MGNTETQFPLTHTRFQSKRTIEFPHQKHKTSPEHQESFCKHLQISNHLTYP